MADGKLIFDTGLDDSGVTSDLDALKGTFQSAFAKIGSVIGAALVIDKVKDFVVQSISLASDLAEVQNVVDVTFGNSADTINDWAKKASEAYGLTELQAKQYTSTMGAMLKSSGLSGDAIVSMSEDLAGLTADFASFYNLDHEDAFEKIRSGISGETEPLKQLGINMSVANLEAYALSQGITTAYNSMTQAEQTTLRYNYLMSVTADAQGDFARTSDGYANQIRSLSNNVTDLSASFGAKLLPSVNDVVKALNDELTSDKAADAMEDLGDAAANATEKVGKMAILIIQNGDKIAAAGKAAATAFVLTKSVQGLSALASKAQFAAGMVGILVDANDGAKIASTALAKELSLLQLGLGVVTGKVKIATAAQLAYDAALAAFNPAALIAGVGIAVISLSVFANSLIEESNEVRAAKDAVEELAESHEALSASFDSAAESIKTQLSDSMAEIGYVQNLKTELDGLVDTNGKVKAGYEDRVSFILNQLSEATGIEMSLQDGVIQGYAELGAAIDEYIEKKKAEAYSSIANETLKTELKNQQDYLIAYQEYQQTRAEIQQQIDDVDKGHSLQQQQSAQARINALEEELAAADEDWAAIAEKYEGGQQRIAWAEEVLAAATEGNFQRLEEAFYGVGGALEEMTGKSTEELSAQLDEVNYWLPLIKALYDQYGDEELADYISKLEQKQTALEEALNSQKTTVEEKTPEHAEIWKKLGYESYDAYCVAVRSGKTAANQAGEEVASSGVAGAGSQKSGFAAAGADGSLNISAGILSKSGTVSGSAKSVAEAAKTAAGSVKTHSVGSDFAAGIANGIGGGIPGLISAAVNAVSAAYHAAKRWLQSHSPSKRTEKGLGVPWTQGVGVGIISETPKLMSTAREAMHKAVAAARSAINEAQISTSLSVMPAVISSGNRSAGDTKTVYQTMYFGSEQSSPSDVKREARRGAKQGLAGGTA